MSYFTVTVQPSVLRSDVVRGQVSTGCALADMGVGDAAQAWINGERAQPDARPAADDHVLIRGVPLGGGDKNGLQLIGQIAILAAAAYVSGPAAGFFEAGSVGSSLAFAGTTLVGNLALNALVPPTAPNLDLDGALSARPSSALTGVQNRLAPMEPLPRLYGTQRFFPPLAARPYTEQRGDDQHLYMVFCCGHGPLSFNPALTKIGDVLIGPTVVDENGVHTPDDGANFEDFELVYYPSFDPATDEFRFTRAVNELRPDLPLDADDDRQVQTTSANTRRVSIDVRSGVDGFVQLLGRNQYKYPAAVGFKLEYRPVGGAWTTVDSASVSGDGGFDANFPSGADWNWSKGGLLPTDFDDGPAAYLVGNDFKFYAINIEFDLPGPGQYEVRLTRVNTYTLGFDRDDTGAVEVIDQDGFYGDGVQSNLDLDYHTDATWTVFRSILNAAPVEADKVEGLAFVELRIRATDQISGTLDNFSVVATALIPDWNGSSWVLAATDNPASVLRHILTGSANPRALPDIRLDGPSLVEWHGYCASNGFSFNGMFDGRTTVAEALRTVASQGRAQPQIRDGQHTVVIDRVQPAPVQMLTPRNSWQFSGSRSYIRQPHALKIRFQNREADWRQDERIVYADGFSADGSGGTAVATVFETMTLFGETRADGAWKQGRYHQAQGKLRPETFSCMVDFEHLICQRGDRVQIQHDAILVGIAAARITSRGTNSAGQTISITLDEFVSIESLKTYSVRIRSTDDGSQQLVEITNPPGETRTLNLLDPVADVQEGDLVVFGETGRETFDGLLSSIEPGPELTARVTAVPYKEAIYAADQGDIPAYDPFLTLPPAVPPAPVIHNVVAGQAAGIRNSDGSVTPRIIVSFSFPSGSVPVPNVRAGIRREGELAYDTAPLQPNTGQIVFQVSDLDADHQIRIQGVSDIGTPGPFAIASVPAEAVVIADAVALTLSEQTNTPPTPNGDLSTVLVTVDPPGEAAYSHSIIEYRLLGETSWFTTGPTDGNDQVRQILNSDGSTYEFRARSVSTTGVEDIGGITAQITLSNIDGDPGNPDVQDTLPALNVAGLQLVGGGAEFTGRDPSFIWDDGETPDYLHFKDYEVTVTATNGGSVLRREYVTQAQFTYSYEKNATDSSGAGLGGPQREITVSVVQRTRQGVVSDTPATLAVSNPPPVVPGTVDIISFFDGVEISFARPTDLDFERARVHLATSSGFTPSSANQKHNGPETDPIQITGLTGGTTYYVRIILVDSFGDGPPSAELDFATGFNPFGDETAPNDVTGLALSQLVREVKLFATAQVTATWDASSDNSGQLFYEISHGIQGQDKTIDTTTDTTFVIFPAQIGETYEVMVRAVDYSGNASAWTASETIAVGDDASPPANVSNATAVGGLDKVVVSWKNPADDDWLETDVNRGTSAGFSPSPSNLVYSGRGDVLVDSDVSFGANYYYKFITRDASGNTSAASAAIGPATSERITPVNIDSFIEDAALATKHIADEAIVSGKLAELAVEAQKLADGAVIEQKIFDGAVGEEKLANLAVTTAKIDDAAINSAKIANLAVGNAAIDNGAISSAKIEDLAVTDAKIASLAVTSAKIRDAAIVEAKIGTAAVTTAKIDNLAVSNAKIASLDAGKINTGLLNANRIGANTITASKINVSNLSSISANIGEVTSGTITGLLVRTAVSSPRVELSSAEGLEVRNSSSVRTVHLDIDGSAQFGVGADAISIDTSGNISVPGAVIAGTIEGNTIRTNTAASWYVELEAGSIPLKYTNGSVNRFEMDQFGNISMDGNITLDGNISLTGDIDASSGSISGGIIDGAVIRTSTGSTRIEINQQSNRMQYVGSGITFLELGNVSSKPGTNRPSISAIRAGILGDSLAAAVFESDGVALYSNSNSGIAASFRSAASSAGGPLRLLPMSGSGVPSWSPGEGTFVPRGGKLYYNDGSTWHTIV